MIKIDKLKVTNGRRWDEYRLNIKGTITEEYLKIVPTDDGFNIERVDWCLENGDRVYKRAGKNNYAIYTRIDLGWLEGLTLEPDVEYSDEDCVVFWRDNNE